MIKHDFRWSFSSSNLPLINQCAFDILSLTSLDVLAYFLGCLQFHEFWPCRFGVSPFTPLKGLFIQGPVFISFFLAVMFFFKRIMFLSMTNDKAFRYCDVYTVYYFHSSQLLFFFGRLQTWQRKCLHLKMVEHTGLLISRLQIRCTFSQF